MTVKGKLRAPREGERYFAVTSVEEIDDHEPEEARVRAPFKELVPLYPEKRIILEGTEKNPLEMRIVDLVTPIGRGQRGLIVAPPRTGKTVLLQMLANSIVEESRRLPPDHPAGRRAAGRGDGLREDVPSREVISSTFDEPAARHVKVAEMVMQKAQRLVEAGEHVVILLDSITRLARANNVDSAERREDSVGRDGRDRAAVPEALLRRRAEHRGRGSLTILATALIETAARRWTS